ncbi:hypothetical protein [Jatrophihabitans sp.]|uniref:phage tail tube protein n=1 Tax=Jatrophihabitans sp. TaxID=1932789 RepID=UPI0030C6A1DC|nr:hypothetical protein [Jatrophihabitans sp.]
MSRVVFDGQYHVYWLAASPANPSAPTVAEISAGVELTAFTPKDGFNPNVTNNKVSGGDLSTRFMDESMGTWASSLELTMYLDNVTASNTAWNTLTDFATGAIVVCPYAAAATAVKAMVWPDVELGVRRPMQTGENTRQKFSVDAAVRKEPKLNATVA